MIQETQINSYDDLFVHKDILTAKDGLPHVAGYVRMACQPQNAVESHSLDLQRCQIREFFERRFREGCRLFWVSDIGVSGSLAWKRDGMEPGQYRIGLTILVDMIKQGFVENVCVYRVDRLSRSPKVYLEFVEECIRPLGVSLYSVAEMTDGSGDVLTMIAELVQHTLCSQRGNVVDGLHARIRDGYTLGRPPYGWTSEDTRTLARCQRVGIEPVAAEAAIVRRIIGEFLEGRTPPQIAEGLTSDNLRSPGGARQWPSKSVRKILRCPVHFGLVKSVDGTLVRGAHYDRRLFDESVFHDVTARIQEAVGGGANG